MTLATGTRLGPYEIASAIGAGGMGEVYRGRDPRLGREVAIKVLPASFSSDPQRLRRFEQEARAAAALNHPNILAVYDIGTNDGSPYIVSELLEGETLRQRLRSGPLSVRKAVDYAAQVARGLAAAHGKGIVHRDLKPENIFVTSDGRVKILDFGLAKLTRQGAAMEDQTKTVQSDPGLVVGTLGYMAPEQVRGGEADARSDLFSFGAVLYEMLSGQRAFHGSTPADTVTAILKEEPPELSATSREISPALENIVRHCLEKNPEERFQSARDIAFDLQSVSGISSQSAMAATAQPTARTHVRLAAVAALVVAALAAAFGIGWRLKPAVSPMFKQLTFRRGTVTAARFAPDGQNVIYSATWEGSSHPELFTARTDGVLSRSLEVGDADLLAISGQGEMAVLQQARRIIGYERKGTLARMPLSGGAARDVLDGVEDADWSKDGANLAVIRSEPKYQIEFPAGHVLATAPVGWWFSAVRISPDQQHIAFAEHPSTGDDRGDISVLDLNGHKRVLATGWSSIYGLAWSPAGDEVWFAASNTGGNRSLYAVSLAGRLRLVLRVPGSLALFDIARDGRVLLAEVNARRVLLGWTPGSTQERDLTWLDYSRERDLTPDGRWLLFDEEGDGGGPNYSIYLRKTDGSPAVRLGDNDAPAISPDGKWVLATTQAEGGGLVLIPTGTGEPRPLNTAGLSDPWGRFSPDGKRLLLATEEPRAYVLSLDGGTPRPVTPPGVRSFWLTADGKNALGRDGQQNWALYPLEGGPPTPLPKWTPGDIPINHTTDNHSFYVRNGELPVNVYLVDVLTGKREFVRQLRPSDPTGMENISSVLMTPDGKYYVYGGNRELSDLFVVSGLK